MSEIGRKPQPSERARPNDDKLMHRKTNWPFALAAAAIIILVYSAFAKAESVTVKYRGAVDLASFECTKITRSSFIHRVCYDEGNTYMIIQLGPTYYHYCGVDSATVSALLNAASVGKFFNADIKDHFDCRITPPPKY